jgi:nickel-dependent lactate racemase
MTRSIELPYGDRPLAVDLADDATVLESAAAPAARPIAELCAEALAAPIAAPPLASLVRPRDRVTLIVSDGSRDEPRGAMARALFEHLGAAADGLRITVAIANGTHRPGDPARLGLADLFARAAAVVNHDGEEAAALVDLGTTRRGTPLRVHRCAVEADLVIATGRIRPHYFAGFGAGAKAIFPGLGESRAVRVNHLLKAEAGARAGVVAGNPCRDDLEEVLDHLPTRAFLLNVVLDDDGGGQAAVAGDIREAFRAGARACAALHQVPWPGRRRVVVVSDRLPVTASLYQASKLVAAAAPVLADGGILVVAAQCGDGIGPVDTVNRAIFELGLRPRLPTDHIIYLISDLGREAVAPSYCRFAPSLKDLLTEVAEPPLVLPRASSLLFEDHDHAR